MQTEIKIDKVILNPDYAIIRRKGEISINPGRNQITLINLDPDLDESSIRLMVSGDQLIVHNISFEKVEIEDDAELIRLQSRIEKIDDNLEILDQNRKDEEFWLEYYSKIREYFADFFAKGYSTGKVTIADYTQFSEYMEKQIIKHEEDQEQIITKHKQLEDEKKELDKMIEDLKEIQSKLEKGLVTLTIDNASKSQKPVFEIDYIVSGTSWSMHYELNHDDTEITLNKWITITNSSSESWQNVILTVTDKIRTDLSIDLPSLAFIDPEEGIESDFLIPVQSMTIESRVDVDNNNKTHKFEIGKESIDNIRYTYYWNAHDFNPVIEVLIFTMKHDYLYPAPINIFLNGIFVDIIDHIDFTPPNEEIAIPLREIETFMVSKQAQDKKVSESGILAKQVEIMYTYKLEVSNPFENQTIPLIIHDRIPKPKILGSKNLNNLNVNVDYTKISSTPYFVYESGLVRWELDLEPLEQKQIEFSIHLVRGE